MKKISAYTAVLAAITYAGLSEQETGDVSARRADGLYEVQFASDWTQYDCFVDETDGEVLGFDARPLPEHVMLSEYSRMTA
jgi:hypothetical protein